MDQRKERGITLVALVITIIVMLIIAGVAISAISTGGVPFGKVKEGAEKYKQGSINEANDMNGVYGMLDQTEPSIDTSKATQANAPVLVEGMTPIVWDESKKEWLETTVNVGWYGYEEQTGTTEIENSGTSKWANVKMPDGSMFVWIPRYAYQISSGYHTGGSGVKGVIDVVFIKDTSYTDFKGNANYGGPTTAPTYNGDKQTNWIVHPVFRANTSWGGWTSELPGIWVAKFEATEKNGNTTINSDSATYQVQILPNKVSWRSIMTTNMYNTCQNATYGYVTKPNTINSHMMKNTEWGAMYTTGYSGGTKISASSSDTTYSYETPQGQLASTTGNIYGVYDMSGGAWEYVAGIYSSPNSPDNLQNIVNAADQYKNTYTTYSASQYGDATYETSSSSNSSNSSWYADYCTFANSVSPVLRRGGHCSHTTHAGLFYFSYGNGNGDVDCGFRPVLVVSTV